MLSLERLNLRLQGNDLLGVLRGVPLQLLELGLKAVFIQTIFLLGQAFLQRQLLFRTQRVVLQKRMHLLLVLPEHGIGYLLRGIDAGIIERDILLQGRFPLAAFPFLLGSVQLVRAVALVVLAALALCLGFFQGLLKVPKDLNFAPGLFNLNSDGRSRKVATFLLTVFRRLIQVSLQLLDVVFSTPQGVVDVSYLLREIGKIKVFQPLKIIPQPFRKLAGLLAGEYLFNVLAQADDVLVCHLQRGVGGSRFSLSEPNVFNRVPADFSVQLFFALRELLVDLVPLLLGALEQNYVFVKRLERDTGVEQNTYETENAAPAEDIGDALGEFGHLFQGSLHFVRDLQTGQLRGFFDVRQCGLGVL